MITRREFIKAFGALVGAGAVGSVVKPIGDVVAGDVKIDTCETPPAPHIVATDNVRYPTSPLATRCARVDEHGQVQEFLPGAGCPPGKTWPEEEDGTWELDIVRYAWDAE